MINKQKFYSRALVSAIIILTLVSIASVTVNAAQNPALNIKKVANVTSYSTEGQTITCTYNVTNSGNVDILGNITVTDGHISSPITIVSDDLAPGNSVTGTAIYTITQPDIDAGSMTNSAYATNKNTN